MREPAPCPCVTGSTSLGAGESQGNKYAVLAFIPWLVLAPVAVVLVGKMEQMPPGYRVVRFVVHGPGLRAIPQAPGQLICMPHKGARVDFKGSESFLHGRIGAALTDALAVRCALAGLLPSRRSASGSLPFPPRRRSPRF
ncbi:hypothetical protein BJ912DRAFT_1058036 [Pholiota molesta]|nr:hypothetical protein BJ912DRAFT_1058036 [Pholiota molesta]